MKPSPRITLPTDIIDDERIITTEAMLPDYSDLIAGIIFKLLCYTAANKGYFLLWDSNRTIAVTLRKAGIRTEYSKVVEIVKELIEQDFFNKEVFEKHGVLVNDRLQETYLKAVSRRRNVELETGLLVVGVPESLIKTDEEPVKEEKKEKIDKCSEPKPQPEVKEEKVSAVTAASARPQKTITQQSEERYFEEIATRQENLQYLAMQVKLSYAEVLALIPEFIVQCKSSGHTHSDADDCYRHFAGWVRKYIEIKREKAKREAARTPYNYNPNTYAQPNQPNIFGSGYSRDAQRNREAAIRDAEFQEFIGNMLAGNRS